MKKFDENRQLAPGRKLPGQSYVLGPQLVVASRPRSAAEPSARKACAPALWATSAARVIALGILFLIIKARLWTLVGWSRRWLPGGRRDGTGDKTLDLRVTDPGSVPAPHLFPEPCTMEYGRRTHIHTYKKSMALIQGWVDILALL